ncbi:large ribosomal subunit protein eL39-like [Chiloscyllium punctatum]|uniref:large ribosomal subunit protein eL39-like n=1 Tax=Chiloscyllium punctatum TaxID=137246 RepID=UPI003B63267B
MILGHWSWERKVSSIPSHRTFRIQHFLTKKMKPNWLIPQWACMKTGIRYNSKRRSWRRVKLTL